MTVIRSERSSYNYLRYDWYRVKIFANTVDEAAKNACNRNHGEKWKMMMRYLHNTKEYFLIVLNGRFESRRAL